MPGSHNGFHTSPGTIEEHASRTEERGSSVRGLGRGASGTSLHGNALGAVGAGLTGTVNGHYQHMGDTIASAGDHLTTAAGHERTNATNYRQSESDNESLFRGINAPEPPASHVHGENGPAPTARPTGRPPVSDWQDTHLPAGTTVYHATSHEHAYNIFKHGIRPAADPTQQHEGPGNAWGGGELGSGFYTHANQESAQNYVANDPVTFEFKTNKPLDGKQRPGSVPWIGDINDEDYRQGGGVITNPTNPGEIKFHNGGDDLQITGIHWNGNKYHSYDEYDQAVENDWMVKPSDMYGS